MPETAPLLELRDVDLFRGPRQLLQQIDLQLRPGRSSLSSVPMAPAKPPWCGLPWVC